MDTNELESKPHTNINKLFNNDVFIYDATNKTVGEIIDSPLRQKKDFAAVLIVANCKTYGREPNKPNKTTLGRLLYQCVPNDPAIPIFLVPYEIKQLGFNKSIPNLYVTIAFKDWTNKHPIGTITQLIGAVNQLEHFYEYQLHCKSLNTSLHNFNKAAINALKVRNENDALFSTDEDRSLWTVFTIDPKGCVDFDDAFSVTNLEDNGGILVSVYIANAAMCLELLNLWPFISERTSTIYLPNGKRPMLPAVLGDDICSLKAGEKRNAFTLDIHLSKTSANEYIVENTTLSNCLIQVKRNYVYEERELLKNADYNQLLVISKELTKHADYSYLPAIGDSHDVVAYFMLFMNHCCAKYLKAMNIGILRRTEAFSLPYSMPLMNADELCRGEYVQTQEDHLRHESLRHESLRHESLRHESLRHESLRHESLNLDVYTHITSPIRRMVDLLNMLILQQSLNLFKYSLEALQFCDKWINKLEHINDTMRKIKRVQNDCELLHLCNKSTAMLDKTYDGHCYDKRELNGIYEYSIYLPELKIVSNIRVPTELDVSVIYKCKLYMFHNEEKYKRKIRAQLLS
jgi:exoribonuclease R